MLDNRAVGPDLSHWKLFYDPEGAPNKADFAITKATEGTGHVDYKLKEIWAGIQKLSIRGLFHYQRSGMSWSQQADHFLKYTTEYCPHIIALDVEPYNNIVNDQFLQDSYRILQYLKEKVINYSYTATVMLYTNPDIFEHYLFPIWVKYFGSKGQDEALNIPLWIAQYWEPRSSEGNPGMPKQRLNWDIWQWTEQADPTHWGAGSAELDLNVYNGTVEKMKSWLKIQETNPNPEPVPVPIPVEIDPEPEEGLWKAKVVASTKVHIRTYPKVSSETRTGYYVVPGQIFTGRLWSGNGYVWMKVLDQTQPLLDNWVAVRNLEGTLKLLKLEAVIPAEPRPAGNYWRVKHDKENGEIWRAGLPEVHPLFIEPKESSGTHFSAFRKWAQLLSRDINSTFPMAIWEKIYWDNYWIANGQGYGIPTEPRANFVNNVRINEALPRVESLTTGGSFLKGERIGDWVKVEGLAFDVPVTVDFLKANPHFWTRAIYASATGQPFRMLGHKYNGPALIHPLIYNRQYGLYIQVNKLQAWRSSELPDPLKLYL